jgi:hypothetical protein
MLSESRCYLCHAKGAPWCSLFIFKGAPLLVGGNHGESHLLLREIYERLGFICLESYFGMVLSKKTIKTYGAIVNIMVVAGGIYPHV